ncbi:CU044_5270 family protein [Kitasatospora sp. KL5]|uniref:CU044_5270 family protein n=1 Tax=Kitasatospora sp. KL5 TaxID=3425125 RepID=UPI003D6EB1D6
MTTAPGHRHDADEQSERRALARLLPPPPHAGLSAERRHAHRAFLLQEAERPAPSRARRPLLVLAAAAAVAALVLGVNALGTGAPPAPVPPASAASVRLLERAALAAHADPGPAPRGTQYGYVRTVGRSTALSEDGGTMRRDTVSENTEQWTAVDGTRPGLRRTDRGEHELPAPGAGTLNSPTYRLLAALPADPDALLARIRADAELNHGAGSGSTTGPDQEAFTAIGDLLRSSVAPPEVSAALYRAAARIPGVVTVDDAVDAAGRHGTAVARVHGGERSEWIFDPGTLRLLGERTVLLQDGPWGRAGDEVSSIAVVTRGIVDAPGQVPTAGT